jgi:hypothetical protein
MQNRVSVGLGELNRVVVRQGGARRCAACLDSWRPYVAVGPARQSSARPSARHGAPVAWTAPVHFQFALSRARRRLRVAAVASASSRARFPVSPAKQLGPVLRKPLLSTVVELAATAEPR